jgi:hypothetical protein
VNILVIGGASALFASRAALAPTRPGPIVFADEAGYLGAARLLVGGPRFYMGSSPFYRAGYSLLLLPVARLGVEPQIAYRLVVVINSALAASLFPLLFLLLRRSFQMPPAAALGGAIVGATYPTVSSFTQIALSENVLFPLIVVWLLAFHFLIDSKGAKALLAGLAVGACAASLWMVHGRMVVVLGVTVMALAMLAWHRRIPVPAALIALAVICLGLILTRRLDDFVIDGNYGGHAAAESDTLMAGLDSVQSAAAVLRNLLGSAWYLVVASFGLLAMLIPNVVGKSWRGLRRRGFSSADLSLGLLLTAMAGLLIVSALWFAKPTRSDELVYGRYVEPVVPPFIAVGVAMLMNRSLRPRIGRALCVVTVLTLVVAALRSGAKFPGESANRWSIASMPFITFDVAPAAIVGAGFVAAAGAWAVSITSRRADRAVWLVLLALFVPVTAFTQVRLVRGDDHNIYRAGWTSPQEVVESHGAQVGYDTSQFDRITIKVDQYFLPHTKFEPFDATTTPPPARLIFSGPNWSKDHPEPPARILWRDPGRNQVLWLLSSSG